MTSKSAAASEVTFFDETQVCAFDGGSYSYTEANDVHTRTISTSGCPNHPFTNFQTLGTLTATPPQPSSDTYRVPYLPMYTPTATSYTEPVGIARSGALINSSGTGASSAHAVFTEAHTFDQCGGRKAHGHSTSQGKYVCECRARTTTRHADPPEPPLTRSVPRWQTTWLRLASWHSSAWRLANTPRRSGGWRTAFLCTARWGRAAP